MLEKSALEEVINHEKFNVSNEIKNTRLGALVHNKANLNS